MGNHPGKFKILCLPAQSGKTGKMIETIRMDNVLQSMHLFADFFGENEHESFVNFVISANNRALVSQTACRMSEPSISKGVFSWVSGSTVSNITPNDLAFRILKKEVDVVVCCAHAKRIQYVSDVIMGLSALGDSKIKIKIWIDEGDQSILIWQKYESIADLECVEQISPISATIDNIHKKYVGKYSVFSFPVVCEDFYRGLGDCIQVTENFVVESATDYTQKVVTKHFEELYKPGTCLFAPGDMRQLSHDMILDFLISKGFVVAIFNGIRKEVVFPEGRSIDLRPYFKTSDEMVELSRTLARIYTQKNLSKRAFAITGYYCIQRGITFQSAPTDEHSGFLFTHAIIPPVTSKAEAYQVMARVFGNIGHFRAYKPSKIFSIDTMFAKVKEEEMIAHNLAKYVPQGKFVEESDFKIVKGKPVYEISTAFYKCTKETFDSHVLPILRLQFPDWKMRNPFIESEKHGLENLKWKGNWRGWKVMDYKTVEKERGAKLGKKEHRRLTVCYDHDDLGVAVSHITEQKTLQNPKPSRNPFL